MERYIQAKLVALVNEVLNYNMSHGLRIHSNFSFN